MGKSKKTSIILMIAIVLAVINLAGLIGGIFWADQAIGRAAEKTDNEAVQEVANSVGEAKATLSSVLSLATWTTGIGLFFVLAALLLRQNAADRRAEKAAAVRSYSRNLARARRSDRRQRQRKRKSKRSRMTQS